MGDSNYAPQELGNRYFKGVCFAMLLNASWGNITEQKELIHIFLLCQKFNFKLLHNGNYTFWTILAKVNFRNVNYITTLSINVQNNLIHIIQEPNAEYRDSRRGITSFECTLYMLHLSTFYTNLVINPSWIQR